MKGEWSLQIHGTVLPLPEAISQSYGLVMRHRKLMPHSEMKVFQHTNSC